MKKLLNNNELKVPTGGTCMVKDDNGTYVLSGVDDNGLFRKIEFGKDLNNENALREAWKYFKLQYEDRNPRIVTKQTFKNHLKNTVLE